MLNFLLVPDFCAQICDNPLLGCGFLKLFPFHLFYYNYILIYFDFNADPNCISRFQWPLFPTHNVNNLHCFSVSSEPRILVSSISFVKYSGKHVIIIVIEKWNLLSVVSIRQLGKGIRLTAGRLVYPPQMNLSWKPSKIH